MVNIVLLTQELNNTLDIPLRHLSSNIIFLRAIFRFYLEIRNKML